MGSVGCLARGAQRGRSSALPAGRGHALLLPWLMWSRERSAQPPPHCLPTKGAGLLYVQRKKCADTEVQRGMLGLSPDGSDSARRGERFSLHSALPRGLEQAKGRTVQVGDTSEIIGSAVLSQRGAEEARVCRRREGQGMGETELSGPGE